MMSSSTERSKQFRERMTPEKRAEINKKAAIRQKEKRDKLKKNPKTHESYLEFERKRKQEFYRKRKEERSMKSAVFGNKSVFGKGLNKLERALPASPEQATGLLQHALKKSTPVSLLINKTPRRSLAPGTEGLIKGFYSNDSHSKVDPSMNSLINIKTKSGEKIKVSKRYLTASLEETHKSFLKENPENPVSFSKFYDSKPKNVKSFTKIPHLTCSCQYHSDVISIITSLKPFVKINDHQHFVNNFSCEIQSIKCARGDCESCREVEGKLLGRVKEEDLDASVSWKAWENKEGGHVLVQKQGTVKEAVKKLANLGGPFKYHHYVKRTQETAFQELKGAATVSVIVLQVDFAESYAITAQKEIQAAHFLKPTITVFTAAAYSSLKPLYMALISDEKEHSWATVNFYLSKIVEQLISKFPSVRTLKIVSDGSAAQFKNRYNLFNLLNFQKDYGLEVSWDFFATSHGKGAVDGIGGVVKKAVRDRVLAEQVVVETAAEFVEVAKGAMKNVEVLHCDVAEVEKFKEDLKQRLQDMKSIPTTQKLHHFEVQQPDTLVCWPTSKKEDGYKQVVKHNFGEPKSIPAKRGRGRPRRPQ